MPTGPPDISRASARQLDALVHATNQVADWRVAAETCPDKLRDQLVSTLYGMLRMGDSVKFYATTDPLKTTSVFIGEQSSMSEDEYFQHLEQFEAVPELRFSVISIQRHEGQDADVQEEEKTNEEINFELTHLVNTSNRIDVSSDFIQDHPMTHPIRYTRQTIENKTTGVSYDTWTLEVLEYLNT